LADFLHQGQRLFLLQLRLLGVHFFHSFNRGLRKKLLRLSAGLSARPVIAPVDLGHFGLLGDGSGFASKNPKLSSTRRKWNPGERSLPGVFRRIDPASSGVRRNDSVAVPVYPLKLSPKSARRLLGFEACIHGHEPRPVTRGRLTTSE
jgi:hypothetical protein